jgi:peptide-methionine (S)-S-oxide reductase
MRRLGQDSGQNLGQRLLLSCRPKALIGATLLALAATGGMSSYAAEQATVIPAAAVDLPPAADGQMQTAVVAGGCFWGVQAVFQHVKGVESAVSGYAGGEQATAQYEKVGTGRTGHAESVKITFDPRVITYGQVLRIYFSVAHDPTQLNRQGPDYGPQYRSAIFSSDEAQLAVARNYIAQLDKEHVFNRAIATKIEPLRGFYPAEDYHQDYLTLHPGNPYIVFNDLPKLEDLKRLFPDSYRAEPKLVAANRPRS